LIAFINHASAAANLTLLNFRRHELLSDSATSFSSFIQRPAAAADAAAVTTVKQKQSAVTMALMLSGCQNASRQHTIDPVKPSILLANDRETTGWSGRTGRRQPLLSDG